MYGSDYPICTRTGTYVQTADLLREAIFRLSQNEQAQIMGETAVRVYGLSI
jgi:predicted TIM-barrel fold metal-dependent hydrolase